MSISLPVYSDQYSLEDDVYQTLWQVSLKEFVHQFELVGGGVLFGALQQQPRQTVYWAESSGLGTLPLSNLFEWAHFAQAELFDIVAIDKPRLAGSYHLYGCLCTKTPDTLCYLLCWSLTPLSEHQRYGITLYARSQHVEQQTFQVSSTKVALQRTRHQLQTPLALILLYADLLKHTARERQTLEWLESLHSTAETMHSSLTHLTDATSTADSGERSNLRQLVMQCCQELQPWIAEKQITVVYGSQALWLQVNEWQIRQVLQNLLHNAIAFSPVGGQITLEWQGFQREVLIKVSDQGTGLSAEDLRSLGTPFYSRRPGGTGLGLSIAKQMILAHRGSLWAENLADGGAQFCLTLPRTGL